MRTIRQLSQLALLCAVLLLTGCSNDDKAASPHNEQDVSFTKAMIAHHQQAIEMSKLAANAQSSEVRLLGQHIQSAQQPEIDQMNSWLEEWGEPTVDSSTSMMGDHDHMGDVGSMKGMMTTEQMHQLQAATGNSFDTMFLTMMIDHHRGAIDMSNEETANGENAAAKEMAALIVRTQTAEIARMQQMLQLPKS